MWCALLLVPLEPLWLALSFFLFRMLDILKPGPIGWLDKNLKGGLGIMADDLAAGVVTAVGIHGLLLLI
jgi:phosphatidylglycerophosphatase A